MSTVHGGCFAFFTDGAHRSSPADGFWWTILVAYLAPSYKEETEAPHQEVGLEDENAVSRPTGADLPGVSYEGHPVFVA